MRARSTAFITAAALAACAFAATASASAAHSFVVPTAGTAAVGAPIPSASAAQATPGDTIPHSPLNTASDRTALYAYAVYLSSVLKATSTGQAGDSAYISTISGQCKSALASLTQASQLNSVAQSTLTAVGEEMGDDLSITFDASVATPFSRLAVALERLRWSHLSDGGQIVRHFIAAQSAVLYATPSDLCQDALLAASAIPADRTAAQTIPQATRNFIKAYSKASKQANGALNALLTLMQNYETGSEKAVIARIANLAGQISRITKSDMQSSANSLSSVLETV
jgi:hypothetical protein